MRISFATRAITRGQPERIICGLSAIVKAGLPFASVNFWMITSTAISVSSLARFSMCCRSFKLRAVA
ncbi:MAG: hypothetical protein ABW189_01310 [Rickettsiales bacterium]